MVLEQRQEQRNKNARQILETRWEITSMISYYVILKECDHRSYNIKNDNMDDKIVHYWYCDQCQKVRTIKTLGFILDDNILQ